MDLTKPAPLHLPRVENRGQQIIRQADLTGSPHPNVTPEHSSLLRELGRIPGSFRGQKFNLYHFLKTKSFDHRAGSVGVSSTATSKTARIVSSQVKGMLEDSWLIPWYVKACWPYKWELQHGGSNRSRCGTALLLLMSLRGQAFALLLAEIHKLHPCHSAHELAQDPLFIPKGN